MFDGPGCDLGSRADTQLVPDALDVALGRALSDEQALGNLAVRHSSGDQSRYLALPPAQGPSVDQGIRRTLTQGELDRLIYGHLPPRFPSFIAVARPKPGSGTPLGLLYLPL
jgi:hypothetical protein